MLITYYYAIMPSLCHQRFSAANTVTSLKLQRWVRCILVFKKLWNVCGKWQIGSSSPVTYYENGGLWKSEQDHLLIRGGEGFLEQTGWDDGEEAISKSGWWAVNMKEKHGACREQKIIQQGKYRYVEGRGRQHVTRGHSVWAFTLFRRMQGWETFHCVSDQGHKGWEYGAGLGKLISALESNVGG